MLGRHSEARLEWLFSQTVFERSTFGAMLERQDSVRGGLRIWYRERPELFGSARREPNEEPAYEPTARPSRLMQSGGHEPTDEEVERRETLTRRMGELTRRLDAVMRQEGGVAVELALRTYYGAPGAFFLQGDLPRVWSLLHIVHEGQQFMRRMAVMLADEQERQKRANPVIAARLQAGSITVAQLREVPDLDGPAYARMRTCCLVRKREKYRELLPLFEVGNQRVTELYRRACSAWEATADA
jgi:hypothetical protein